MKAATYSAFDSFVAAAAASSAVEQKYNPVLGVAMIVIVTLDGIGKEARSCLEEVLRGEQLNNLEACFKLQALQFPSV